MLARDNSRPRRGFGGRPRPGSAQLFHIDMDYLARPSVFVAAGSDSGAGSGNPWRGSSAGGIRAGPQDLFVRRFTTRLSIRIRLWCGQLNGLAGPVLHADFAEMIPLAPLRDFGHLTVALTPLFLICAKFQYASFMTNAEYSIEDNIAPNENDDESNIGSPSSQEIMPFSQQTNLKRLESAINGPVQVSALLQFAALDYYARLDKLSIVRNFDYASRQKSLPPLTALLGFTLGGVALALGDFGLWSLLPLGLGGGAAIGIRNAGLSDAKKESAQAAWVKALEEIHDEVTKLRGFGK